MRRSLQLSALALLFAAACSVPRRPIEPPPAIWANQPTQTGHTRTQSLSDPVAINRICAASGGPYPGGGYYWACYLPQSDTVVLPSDWPDAQEFRDLRVHEFAHAAGWRHQQDGRGTDWSRSLKPVTMRDADWARLLQQHGASARAAIGGRDQEGAAIGLR